ncbi:MAG: DMT family transporter, partial [Gammaproteobacteria bacterium]|nr:DMT family transporter [Gammaproteobacteria bacterium]
MSTLHASSGRWKLGLALSLTTALMWGVLPIALKLTLTQMDAITVSWYRFLVAAVLVGLLVWRKGKPLGLARLDRTGWVLLAIVILGLSGNYLFYLLGLDYITPGTAQVVIQLAPIMLLVGALVVFRESFAPLQWAGLLIFVVGLILFFRYDLEHLANPGSSQVYGIAFMILAAIVWAAYALAQKQLLRSMGSQRILLCIYVSAVVLFLPWTSPLSIFSIDATVFALLVFASLNTVVAYGAFA